MDVLEFATVDEWESWLEGNHADVPEAWLRIARRNSAVPGLTIEDALDGALCFGWIDGQRKSNDADSFLQRYSPRRRTSSWSQINVEKFEALAAAGRVRPAGFAQRDAARADGRWDAAYESQRTAGDTTRSRGGAGRECRRRRGLRGTEPVRALRRDPAAPQGPHPAAARRIGRAGRRRARGFRISGPGAVDVRCAPPSTSDPKS